MRHPGGLGQQNIHRGFHSIRQYPSRSHSYRSYGSHAPGYRGYSFYGPSSYVLKSYRPLPFPYYTPRIYVVHPPNRGCAINTYSGPAYRNVLVLRPPQNPEGNPAIEDTDLAFSEIAAQLPPGSLAPPAVDTERSWDYLADGDYKSALSAFAAWAAAEPEQSMPKAGFGLAAALSGDTITAAYALRRAFETEGAAPDFEIVDPALQDSMRQLAVDYRAVVGKKPKDLNARFVYAVISHWNREDLAARACLQDAMALGDDSASAANLARIVDQAFLVEDEINPPTHPAAQLAASPSPAR
jgi:hypothetical protein